MRSLLLLLVLCISIQLTLGAVPAGCKGKPNLNPITTSMPKQVKTVKNGILYKFDNLDPPLLVPHVFGSAYQMGYAQGELLKDEIAKNIADFQKYLDAEIENYLSDLPEWLTKLIAEGGTEAALDATYYLTEAYTPKHFLDELHGMADGSGADYMQLVRITQFPELIKAACSMFGAWGPAISKTNGTLYQLRALDWDTSGPLQQFPTVVFYHPTEGSPFSTVSWAGFIGAVSGMSSAPIAICEKVWLKYNGSSSRMGYPWHLLLRDILQFDITMDDALNRIINARRTCSIFVGLGDGHQFRALEYSHDFVNVYDDQNFPFYANHPKMDGAVFIDKHEQPSNDPCLTNLMKEYYGSYDPMNTIQHITAEFQTGDMHIVFYDYAENQMYVSNAGLAGPDQTKAYDRPFVRFDMKAMFAIKAPTV